MNECQLIQRSKQTNMSCILLRRFTFSSQCLKSISRPFSHGHKLDELSICGTKFVSDEWTNVTPKILSFIGRDIYKDIHNPIGLVSSSVRQVFSDFDQFSFPDPVVSPEDNFDSLLIPKEHVSRSKSDTYYINKDNLLRCHTSCHQGHCLKKGSRAFITIADVYRRDAVDRTHHPVFHQCEGLKLFPKNAVQTSNRTEQAQENHDPVQVDQVITDLKSCLESYINKLLGKKMKDLRWVPAFFPFTHPSLELELLINGQWMEVLGAGVVENRLLLNHGISDSIGWAFGVGLERLAMIKYDIPDIRLFWSTDSGFTHQFKTLGSPWDDMQYKPFSDFPQCKADLSFWLPKQEFSSNDFYDLARSVGGDIIEQIELIDDFVNTKSGRRSHCYRIIYRSHERTLTQTEVNSVHQEIAQQTASNFKVDIR